MTRVEIREQVGKNLSTGKDQLTGNYIFILEGQYVGHKHVKGKVVHFRPGLTDAEKEEVIAAAEKYFLSEPLSGKEPPVIPPEEPTLNTEDYDD